MSDADHTRIAALLNLGPTSARWVVAAGITSRAALERLGPVRAYLKIKAQQPRASLNLLWALAGALEGRHFADLPDGMRASLLMELDARMPPRVRTPTRDKRKPR